MGITYNNSDIINIKDTETGLKMLDKLSRIKDGRRIAPLDQLNNVLYPHRYLYDEYNLQIGDTYFMIPPEFIMVNSESTSQSIVTLRQENSQKMKSGYHKRTIMIDLVFNGLEQLNGYRVDGPEGYYYVDGLRQLLAQFKCTPFLPISNEMINGMYGVFTVALQSITMRTMQGFPDVMTAQITLQEVNMFPYLEMPDVCFKYMIDWDLFRFYYQRFLTENYEYKKLQSLPANKDHNRFKLSILDESVLAKTSEEAIESKTHNTSKSVLDIVCDDNNYITWIDSNDSDAVISSFQCGYSNILTNIQLSDVSSPTVQFMGGMDTIYSIMFETTDYSVVQALEQCQISNDLLTRKNRKLHSVGFVKLESELVAFTGSLFVMIESVTTNTVPGFPGLYNVQINCVSYDIAQSSRENLDGFLPFDCDKGGGCGDFEPTHQHEEQAIEQSMAGLYTKIRQDNYAEWKLRTTMEVYPDLFLPTYKEVNDFINKCNTFRTKNELDKLPYSIYPTNPINILHGCKPGNGISISVTNGIAYPSEVSKDMLKENAEYNIFVDPDFYVFYPCSYFSFEEEARQLGESYYDLYEPKQRSSYTKTKIVDHPIYNDYSAPGDSSLAELFVAKAKEFIGHTYKYGADGTQTDAKGQMFDCSGLVTYCLKSIGVLAGHIRHTVSTIMSDNDTFETVKYEDRQKGDLICRMKPSPHVVICEGNGQVVHASNSAPYPRGGVKESNEYFVGTVRRPKAFNGGASTIGSSGNGTDYYVTDEFLSMVKQWEGFLHTTTPKDGGLDIGYGFHNYYFDGTKNVKIQYGMTMTESEASNYLKLELESMIPQTVAKIKKYGWDISQFNNNQVLALTSYFFNRGFNNSKADAILNKANSPTVSAIGNNLPNYWGSATYAKKGLISRRNKEKDLFFSTSGSAATNPYTLTKDEFESICRVVMAETKGEGSKTEKAVAQVIYDRLTHPNKKFGGLSNILNAQDQFPTPHQGTLNSTVEANVRAVFCDGDKQWYEAKAYYFLTPEDTNATYKQRDSMYDRLGFVGKHTFWGENSKGSDIKYTITDGTGTGNASGNYRQEENQVTHEAKTLYDESKFGEPVLVKTDAVIYDDHWTFWGKNDIAKDNAKNHLNSGENIFNSSFCDEYQYSGRGRLVRAFPAYLFCILDDNAQWFDGRKLWTNYYTHRAVVDIAVHGTNDMPTETATITVLNSYHNLDKAPLMGGYSIKDDEGYKTWVREWYKFSGMLLGFGPKLTKRLIELHQVIYDNALLREGARIHLRMGYGSDPLSLAPMINGHVSDVMLGDQIQVVVTSDGHELIQHITSANENDTNNGWLGLFGLGTEQESSNIIAGIMCKRQSWVSYLSKTWFEGSQYSIEHFGLYFNQNAMKTIVVAAAGGVVGGLTVGMTWGGSIGAAVGSVVPVVGTAVGTVAGVVLGGLVGAGVGALSAVAFDRDVSVADLWNGYQEQYDLVKNIYKADYSREHYIYGDIVIDHEQNVVFNKYNMTPWDVFQVCTQQVPEYILKPSYHQFDSRLYFGLPFWMEKYRYDYFGSLEKGQIFEECKASTQVHLLDSVNNIIDNQVRVTSKYSNTNVKVMYTRGDKAVSTQVIHSDDTIDFSKQKTTILDTPITQDALGPDALYEFLGYNIGEESARRVGISTLLYGWQQQYQGQILLMGCPGIKAHDYIIINDSFTTMYGIAIVREVVHSFNVNTGFTTSVTPGMVGFNTDETSGLIETSQNFLMILNCFSSYIETRRQLRNNYESNLKLFADFEIMREKVVAAGRMSDLEIGANVVGGVVRAIDIFRYGKATFKIAKNLYKMHKAAGIAKTLLSGFEGVKTAKGIAGTYKAIKAGVTIASGSVTAGVGSIVSLAVFTVIDVLLSEVIEWFSNKNVCVLLPLWWEAYPFVAGVKDGEKILLVRSNADPSDENTKEDKIDNPNEHGNYINPNEDY